MKSLRDEIRLRRVKRTDLISSSAKCSISSEGFARRFHRGAPQGPRNELAEFWGKGQCLDFTYHTIFRLNMGCSAAVKMCSNQVRYQYSHQKKDLHRKSFFNEINPLAWIYFVSHPAQAGYFTTVLPLFHILPSGRIFHRFG